MSIPSFDIRHGDNRTLLDVMSESSIDSVISDPPYHLTSTKGGDKGFMGKSWDGGGIAFDPEFWKKVYRVLKPGAFLAAFSAPRNYHRMAVAIEDGGFEIQDCLLWAFGSGFPKGVNIAKAIDKKLGHKPKVVREIEWGASSMFGKMLGREEKGVTLITEPSSDEAKAWDGWNVALKPAYEPIVIGRKPFDRKGSHINAANVPYSAQSNPPRFFYSAKVSTTERRKSLHPTVKPVPLMQWLVKLLTPRGGTVLDPFAGTGSTGRAARIEGFSSIMLEREAEYVKDIERKMKGITPTLDSIMKG